MTVRDKALTAARRSLPVTRRGLLVVCEGIDGSGKSTLARRLADALAERGLAVQRTMEPTDSWLGQAVRKALSEEGVSPWTDALLFMADHATHVERARAWLAEGRIVVSDRWAESTFAYQGAALQRDGFDAMAWLAAAEAPFNREPDLVILLDLPVTEALARVGSRGGEREKFEKRDFLERVRENYLRLAREAPSRFVVLDARRPPAELVDDALAAVLARV